LKFWSSQKNECGERNRKIVENSKEEIKKHRKVNIGEEKRRKEKC
jgi:hypothetical protein